VWRPGGSYGVPGEAGDVGLAAFGQAKIRVDGEDQGGAQLDVDTAATQEAVAGPTQLHPAIRQQLPRHARLRTLGALRGGNTIADGRPAR
jgi:hypothetical protein